MAVRPTKFNLWATKIFWNQISEDRKIKVDYEVVDHSIEWKLSPLSDCNSISEVCIIFRHERWSIIIESQKIIDDDLLQNL